MIEITCSWDTAAKGHPRRLNWKVNRKVKTQHKTLLDKQTENSVLERITLLKNPSIAEKDWPTGERDVKQPRSKNWAKCIAIENCRILAPWSASSVSESATHSSRVFNISQAQVPRAKKSKGRLQDQTLIFIFSQKWRQYRQLCAWEAALTGLDGEE